MQIDDAALREILTQTQTIALIGYSNKPHRDSYRVGQFLTQQGYLVYPVNPRLETLDGQPCYRCLEEIPAPIDLVNVFRRGEFLPEIVKSAIAIQAKTLWTQLGIIHPSAAQIAREAGLNVILNACIKIEYQRLQIRP
ncbi:CoA-binding protein [Spirulina subsalsa]|uniref:CoA-binding protein n=1 Tax=Spirulina subsalsa TaxID=54311 RepID=UPI00030C53B8|nr:CoA-binding protein [Spirulina subsalsa]